MINVNGNHRSGVGAGAGAGSGSPKWHIVSRGSAKSNATKKNTKKHQKSHVSVSTADDFIMAANAAVVPPSSTTLPSTSTSTSVSFSSSATAVSPSVGKKFSHNARKNTGMCDILDSPQQRKVSLSWREDALSPSNDQSMLSADLSGSDTSIDMRIDDDDDGNNNSGGGNGGGAGANTVTNLKLRISELENEYQQAMEMSEKAKKSVAEERKRQQELLAKKDALVRRHFNATVLRAKLEIAKKMTDDSCSPALNMNVAQLYDEAVEQGISPEMYDSWIHTRFIKEYNQ